MTKTYNDYIKTGDMSQHEAIRHQSVRDASKGGMLSTLSATAAQGLPADAAAFGALDIIAIKFVEWYGPEATGEVFRHYADVCEKRKVAKEGGA